MSAVPAINLAGLFPNASEGLLGVLNQLQMAQTAANTANEQRYQDILGLYGGMGTAGNARIGQAEQQTQAQSTQDLSARGLGNTTITGAMNRGIANDAEFSRQQLQERVAMDKAGVMERRTDQGPNMALYANLIRGATAGQQTPSRPAQNIGADFNAGLPDFYRKLQYGFNGTQTSPTPKGPLNNSGGYGQGENGQWW
jgi:hypothetical protein